MIILIALSLALLLGAANPMSAPFFPRSTSQERADSTAKNKHTPDRQRGKHASLPGTDTPHSVTTG